MAPPVRDHLLARGALATRANAFLGQTWEKGWLPPPILEADALWAVAAKPFGEDASAAEQSGRAPHEVVDFRERLERLLDAVRGEARLNPLGQAMAYGQLVRVIRNRLSFGQYWASKSFPRDVELMAPPILIIGHMRSGTTRVHHLFAADPAHSHTRYCDAWRPVPGNLALRRLKGTLDLKMLEALNPWLQSIHPMQSGGVEEELAWLAGALNHSIYESQWRIPSYSAWSEARNPGPIYSELARLLTADAVHRGVIMKPRVMKAPQFSEDLATLLKQFPDAKVVLTERDTETVVKSAVSLAANQFAIQTDSADLDEIETLWRHKIALREQRVASALANWDGAVTRLSFDELNTDWESAIERAYRELGLTLTPAARANMRTVMAKGAKGSHTQHSAQLDRFAKQT
ncbi:MAG: sulfotransferase [Pseudomonadota bacterium]